MKKGGSGVAVRVTKAGMGVPLGEGVVVMGMGEAVRLGVVVGRIKSGARRMV